MPVLPAKMLLVVNHVDGVRLERRIIKPEVYQQKITLRQIRCPCVLMHATLNLRPLRPLRPVRPVLPGNARSNSMPPEFPHNAGSDPMPPRSRCELVCVRMGGGLIAEY